VRTVAQVMDLVRQAGGKVTPQRLIIYQVLQGDRSHPTAEAVYDRVRAILPTVSLTTVYKTLNQLVVAGELKRFDVDGVTHFDPDTSPHSEAVCMGCHSIVDVPEPVPAIAGSIAGFEVIISVHTLYGYCEPCRTRNKALAAESGFKAW
jgi:Fur family transcriptional regulator, peroxide stress response regulator